MTSLQFFSNIKDPILESENVLCRRVQDDHDELDFYCIISQPTGLAIVFATNPTSL